MGNRETFTEWLDRNWEEGNLCPPPLNAQLAVYFLLDYLVDVDWYTTMPMSTEQVNTEIVDLILRNYSKKYQKELKERGKK